MQLDIKLGDSYHSKLLERAHLAAIKAGEVLLSYYNKPLDVRFKGEIDIVTEADLASQEIIHNILKDEGIDFLGEETVRDTLCLGEKPCWIVDPLDGTTNFAHGFPWFCVSIAFFDGREIITGVVHAPIMRETFYGVKGHGAYLNGERIKTSSANDIRHTLLATGFPYDVQRYPDNVINALRDVVIRARGIRRAGSAALDLAYVACGRLDGFWEIKLKPWDVAAGILLVKEAGGIVTDFCGMEHKLEKKTLLAACNRQIHEQLLDVLCKYVE